jgi:hypothetical protein
LGEDGGGGDNGDDGEGDGGDDGVDGGNDVNVNDAGGVTNVFVALEGDGAGDDDGDDDGDDGDGAGESDGEEAAIVGDDDDDKNGDVVDDDDDDDDDECGVKRFVRPAAALSTVTAGACVRVVAILSVVILPSLLVVTLAVKLATVGADGDGDGDGGDDDDGDVDDDDGGEAPILSNGATAGSRTIGECCVGTAMLWGECCAML